MNSDAAHRHVSTGALAFAWCGAAVFVGSLTFFGYSYFVRFGQDAGAAGPRLAPVVIDTLLFSGFALHHSIFARSGVRSRIAALVGPALERSSYVWLAGVLFIAVCAWWQPVPGDLYHLRGAAAVPGYALVLAGVVVTARGSARLDVLDLAGVRPMLRARPASVPHTALQTDGVYGVVRHPVYLAWVLMVFGVPHMTMTRFVFAVVSTTYLAIAIPFEERGLEAIFGDAYRAYRARVRWRMLPGLY